MKVVIETTDARARVLAELLATEGAFASQQLDKTPAMASLLKSALADILNDVESYSVPGAVDEPIKTKSFRPAPVYQKKPTTQAPFVKRGHKPIAPHTAAIVAMVADGATPREIAREMPNVPKGSIAGIPTKYRPEIEYLKSLPKGQARFDYLQARFGFGGVPIDTTIGARVQQ